MVDYLITGSNGFIGSQLVKFIEMEGFSLFCHDRTVGDILQKSTWEKFPKSNVLVHLADKTDVLESWDFPPLYINHNCSSIVLALEYCRLNKSKLILLSTYLYGNSSKSPVNERASIEALNPYALSKKLSEEITFFYSHNFSIPVLVLRLFNVYGVGQSKGYLIPTIIDQIKNSDRIVLGCDDLKRDYVHVSDVCSAILLGSKYIKNYEIYNVGSGKSISISDLVQLILKISNKSLMVEIIEKRRPNQIYETLADISKIKRDFNWSPKIKIEEGLNELLNGI